MPSSSRSGATIATIPKPKPPSEYDFHRSVVAFLSKALHRDTWWAHVPNGGYRHATEAKRLKAMAVVPGTPDLLLIHRGAACWLELKRKGGYLSPAQNYCHQRLLLAGSPVSVCRTIEDVEAALVRAGIPIKARLM
jgi:hypothetical protein